MKAIPIQIVRFVSQIPSIQTLLSKEGSQTVLFLFIRNLQ
jgi:hypothetical protein